MIFNPHKFSHQIPKIKTNMLVFLRICTSSRLVASPSLHLPDHSSLPSFLSPRLKLGGGAAVAGGHAGSSAPARYYDATSLQRTPWSKRAEGARRACMLAASLRLPIAISKFASFAESMKPWSTEAR